MLHPEGAFFYCAEMDVSAVHAEIPKWVCAIDSEVDKTVEAGAEEYWRRQPSIFMRI